MTIIWLAGRTPHILTMSRHYSSRPSPAHHLYPYIQHMKKTQKQLNEYTARGGQVQQIIDGRYLGSEQKRQWSYEQQVRQVSSKNKFKYQDVEMSHKIDFLDDMKSLIFDPKRFPEDANLFTQNSGWKLVAFQEEPRQSPEAVPSNACIKKRGMSAQAHEAEWGTVLLQGRLSVKFTETGYTPMCFNLRRRAIFFYQMVEPQRQDRQAFMVHFTETTFNFLSENDEFFSLKFSERVLRIKKENQAREALKAIERCLFLASFRGAFCLRNQVPSCYVEDYVLKEIDAVRGVDFSHETKLKGVAENRYYREAIGGFFYLLNKESFKRKTLSGEIALPRWLKQNFRSIPACDINLITNVVPQKNPLMNLRIKLHESQMGLLSQNLKYIFPFYKNYIKRTLVLYQSSLQDEQVSYMMNQISYPMHTIGLPKNNLSLLGLEHVINAANTLYHEVIDCSYNSKLISVSGSKIFSLANANPSVKKLTLRGCYVLLGQEEEFFQGLSNNMCLQEFEIDYYESYNESMIKNLTNYDAEIY